MTLDQIMSLALVCGIFISCIGIALSSVFQKLELAHIEQLLKEGRSVNDYE